LDQEYVPGPTRIESSMDAASIAACMVGTSPEPSTSTRHVREREEPGKTDRTVAARTAKRPNRDIRGLLDKRPVWGFRRESYSIIRRAYAEINECR
jgi:hypothetical protein